MFNPVYLTLSRHNVYYFRWPIPAALHPQRKHTHIKVSLKTREPREALRLAKQLAYHTEQLVQRLDSSMDYTEIKNILQAFFSRWLSLRKAEIAKSGQLPAERMYWYTENLESAELAIERGEDDFTIDGTLDEEHIDRVIRVRKLAIEKGSADYQLLRQQYKFAYAEYCRGVISANDAALKYDFSTPLQASSPTSSALTLKDAIEDFIAERKRGDQWTQSTEKDRRAQFSLLCEILGENISLVSIQAQHAMNVKKILQELPKGRNKNPKTRNLPITEAVKVHGVEKLHVKTVNEYLTAYQSLFGWASDNGIIERNPFKNLAIKQKKSRQENRQAFTTDQIQSILSAIQPEKTSKPYRYWGVMLGIYTGARLNEIAQLELEDIKQSEGIWYFDINDEADEDSPHQKRLKNESSKRRVPIHDALLSAGIIEYAEQLKKAGHKRLFPDLTYVEGHKYGRKLGRWFNDTLLVSLGMKGSKLSFHSFRHTFTTVLLNAGVQEGIVQELLGHAKHGTTQVVYNKGYNLEAIHSALQNY